MDKVLIGLSQVSSEVNADIYVRFIKKNGKFFLLDTDSSNDNIPCEWIVLGLSNRFSQNDVPDTYVYIGMCA